MKTIQNKIVWYVLGLCMTCVIVGCGGVNGTIAMKHNWDQADENVTTLFSSFTNYQQGAMENIVDDDFTPAKSTFMNDIEKAFYEKTIQDIDYDITTVNRTRNKLAVDVHWRKKQTPRDGKEQQLSEGDALFVFIERDNALKLYQIKGDNPF